VNGLGGNRAFWLVREVTFESASAMRLAVHQMSVSSLSKTGHDDKDFRGLMRVQLWGGVAVYQLPKGPNILLTKRIANQIPHTSPAMYEDLNEIATLRLNKELESISSQTREKVREMQNEYAAITSSSVRSGPQEAAIGRAQIEGSEQLVRALYEIWVDLVKRRKGYISRSDVDFIVKKLEAFAQTQKGHLHKAFSTQRMGAVVNLLTEEAGRRLYAATANFRGDLAIMVREHELFSQSAEVAKQTASGAVPTSEDGHQPHNAESSGLAHQPQGHRPDREKAQLAPEPSITEKIWSKIWSWIVVSALVLLALGLWGTFLTSGHPWAADGFCVVASVLFLAKFLTWEDARKQSGPGKFWLLGGTTVLVLIFTTLALRWDHTIDQLTSAPSSQGPPAARTVGVVGQTLPRGSGAPKEPSGNMESPTAEGQTLSVAKRVKVIIAGHFLAVPADDLTSNDDFESNLGADPYDVSSLMDSLELEFGITIPPGDRRNLHTVGETISYVEKSLQAKQGKKRTTSDKIVPLNAKGSNERDAATSTANESPVLHYILESDFDEQVLKAPKPVLVFFCTDSQAACPVMAPIISSIAQERQAEIKVIAIDVFINKGLPEAYGAGYFEVPVTILFSGGTERGRITGAASKEAVEHLINDPQAFGKKAAKQDPLEAVPNVPESDFSRQVLKAEVPVLVYFYSPNEACKQVSPLVSQIAGEHKGKLAVMKVDSYTESELASEYDAGDDRDPLLILFRNGEARGTIKGTTSIATIESLILHPENFPFQDDALPNVSAILEAIPSLHETDLPGTLRASSLPSLVYFYNNDKDPNCRAVASLISAIAEAFKGRINFFRMDTSTARDISYKYDSWNGPSLVVFKGTKLKDRKSGIISKGDVTRMLNKVLTAK